MSTAFLFPGQGSQFVGMGKDHYDSNPDFAEIVDQANEILGIDLKTIMFEGPEDKLKQTEFTQPAIFLHSVALYKTLDATPDMVAGHSLGEFSALVACGAVSFEDALKIVRRRGELMQAAGASNPGTMAAIIGMDDDKVEAVCEKAKEQTGRLQDVGACNPAVKAAVDIAKEDGARMAMLLPVSGAFHSSLMEPAFVGLKESLENLSIKVPSCPIYSNFTAEPTSDVEEIRSNLLNQLMNPVRWTQTLQNMLANGATSFVEVGPGKVLQGLVKRTDRKAEISGYQ